MPSEVLVQFDEPHVAQGGKAYVAQVRGRLAEDGLWEAWIDFVPADGGEPIRTGRETEQLSRGDLRYWAAGLSSVYLDDALTRALASQSARNIRQAALAALDLLAESEYLALDADALLHAAPVLDPFTLYRLSGEYVLRQELRTLDAAQLRDIIAAYGIPEAETADLARTFEDALAEQIVACVQHSVEDRQLSPAGNGVQPAH